MYISNSTTFYTLYPVDYEILYFKNNGNATPLCMYGEKCENPMNKERNRLLKEIFLPGGHCEHSEKREDITKRKMVEIPTKINSMAYTYFVFQYNID